MKSPIIVPLLHAILFIGLVPPHAAIADDPSPLKDIVIVYKTHFDIGYTQLARDVAHQYRTEMTDGVLEAIERNAHQAKEKQFVWTLSGWPMTQLLAPEQAPERRARVSQALRDGNLAVHALSFTMHDETSEPEDLVRSLGLSSAIARQHDLPLPRDAKTTDVPGHSWILPTLLTHAGVRFYHMGGPLVNRSFDLPLLFWWEGPDGSRLLTLYRNDYGTPPLPPSDWRWPAWVYIHMTADNEGPPPPDVVERDLAYYRQHAPGARVRIGKLEDFADLVLAAQPELPVVRSDLPDPWIHGLLSHPSGTKQAHNLRPLIPALDALTTLGRAWGLHRPSVASVLDTAYRNSALYSEHTWGLATQHYIRQPYGPAWEDTLARGWPRVYDFLEESNLEHDDYITRLRLALEPAYADAVSTLADQVSVSGPRLVVFNPLPWVRDGLVELNTTYFPQTTGVRRADGAYEARVERSDGPALEGQAKIIRFVAKDLPPLGYQTYSFVDLPEPGSAPKLTVSEKDLAIESPFFKAVFDPREGRIASLVDKRTGRELVEASAPQGFGQYFYERFGRREVLAYLDRALYPQYQAHRNIMAKGDLPDAPYESAVPRDLRLHFQATPVSVSAVMYGNLPGPGPAQTVSTRLTLYAELPLADLEVSCDKPLEGWPEAGWICLPFQIQSPHFRLGKLGGDVDPAKDITVENANYHQFWLHTGAAVYEDAGFGVGLCPLDSPLVSLGEPGSHKFDPRYEPRPARVFVNLFNNQWQTNFRNWTGGRITSRVRLWTFDRFEPEPALFTPAFEARTPLRAARSRTRPGPLPATQPGLTLSRRGLLVTAFGEDPDGQPGTLLRVWEQGGHSGPLTLELPTGLKAQSALPVNLRGQASGPPLTISQDRFTAEVGAYSPATFILR